MNIETVLFCLFLFTLMCSGATGVRQAVMPNVVAILLLLLCNIVGLIWASSCFPSGFMHFFMPILVMITCTRLLGQIAESLSPEICRQVMMRVSACVAVPVLLLLVWAVPQGIEDYRQMARAERRLNATYATLRQQQVEFAQRSRDLQALLADHAFTVNVIVNEAVEARYGDLEKK